MRQLFKGCIPEYVSSVCHGRCCDGSGGLSVVIQPDEQVFIEAKGGIVVNGLLQPDSRGLCPFKWESGLCTLHGTGFKPFGCVASPLTLNKNNTLIIRNRYRRLRCYKGGATPAYHAFDASLYLLFGESAKAIINKIDKGDGDFMVPMSSSIYQKLTLATEIREQYATS